MLSLNPCTFGLHDGVPEADLDPAWRPRVHQHTHTLATMLQRLQVAMANRPCPTEVPALAAATEQFLMAQAQEHVSLAPGAGGWHEQAPACVVPIPWSPGPASTW